MFALDYRPVLYLVVLLSQIIEENAVSQVKEEIRIQKMCGHHQFITKFLLAWQSRTQLFIGAVRNINETVCALRYHTKNLYRFPVCEYKSGGDLLNRILECGPLPEVVIRLYVAELTIALGKTVVANLTCNCVQSEFVS